MKAIVTLLILGAVAAAGSLGFVLTGRVCPADQKASSEAQPAAPAPASADIVALDARVAELERLLLGMRAEVARLSSDGLRTAVAAEPAATESAPAETVAANTFNAAQRQAIVEVIEADRVRREDERKAEEQRRAEQRILDRAATVARELGLGVADEKRLGDLMIAGTQKRDEMFQQMREGDFGDDARTRVRESFTALRTAYESDLTSAFGADLAKQIMERTDLGGGRRGGDFRGGDFFGGGGQGSGPAGVGPEGGGGDGRRRAVVGGAGGGQ